jgi:hypothetical protein
MLITTEHHKFCTFFSELWSLVLFISASLSARFLYAYKTTAKIVVFCRLILCFVGRNWSCHLFVTYPFYFTCEKIYSRSSALTVTGWHFALRVPGAIGLCWLTRTWPVSQGKNKVDVCVASSQLSSGWVAKMVGKVQSALQCTHFLHASFASWNSTRKMEVTCSSETFISVYYTTRRHIPEDSNSNLHGYYRENLVKIKQVFSLGLLIEVHLPWLGRHTALC